MMVKFFLLGLDQSGYEVQEFTQCMTFCKLAKALGAVAEQICLR